LFGVFEVTVKIEFDLLSNAIDSIQRAIELVAWRDEQGEARRLKQAVQAVAHGVELILKERLKRVHPSLIWENVDKYPSLSARTVTAEGAMGRLISIGGLTFSKSDIDLIRALRATRNAIEHFAWSTTKQEVDHIVGSALAFTVHFTKTHLDYEFFGYRSKDDDSLESLLQANPAFAAAFSARDLESASNGSVIEAPCAFCRAISVNPNTRACRLCGHWAESYSDLEDDIPF
jgi:hypothetical protein